MELQGAWQWWPLGRWILAFVLATYLGFSGLKKKSLSRSGAIAVSYRRTVSMHSPYEKQNSIANYLVL